MSVKWFFYLWSVSVLSLIHCTKHSATVDDGQTVTSFPLVFGLNLAFGDELPCHIRASKFVEQCLYSTFLQLAQQVVHWHVQFNRAFQDLEVLVWKPFFHFSINNQLIKIKANSLKWCGLRKGSFEMKNFHGTPTVNRIGFCWQAVWSWRREIFWL